MHAIRSPFRSLDGRRTRRLSALLIALAPALLLLPASPAEATPAWARKYKATCSLCHSAWPTLNKVGREFKLNGFRLPNEIADPAPMNDMIDEYLSLDPAFPITARFIMRPFDKTRGNRARVRSFHEVELIAGARVGKNVSAWFEAEAEDEDEFNLFVEQGVVGYHPAQEANVAFGWAPPFWADPFASLVDGGHRMTRSHKGPLDQAFAAGDRLRDASQFVSVHGLAGQDRVFYVGGISSGGGDPEGRDKIDGFGKVMVEVVEGIYVGGFVHGGTNEASGVDLGFRRTGVDFQVERGNLTLYGLVLDASDDRAAGGTLNTTVGYVEGFYTIPLDVVPMMVPLARIDVLSQGRKDLTLQWNVYLLDNLKAYAEWWQNIDTASGVRKNNRFTVQVDFAF
jgi:hypothetical protein